MALVKRRVQAPLNIPTGVTVVRGTCHQAAAVVTGHCYIGDAVVGCRGGEMEREESGAREGKDLILFLVLLPLTENTKQGQNNTSRSK